MTGQALRGIAATAHAVREVQDTDMRWMPASDGGRHGLPLTKKWPREYVVASDPSRSCARTAASVARCGRRGDFRRMAVKEFTVMPDCVSLAFLHPVRCGSAALPDPAGQVRFYRRRSDTGSLPSAGPQWEFLGTQQPSGVHISHCVQYINRSYSWRCAKTQCVARANQRYCRRGSTGSGRQTALPR